MIGSGKYDDICTEVREKMEAAGVIVIILDGNKGFGFSMQVRGKYAHTVPDLLRLAAKECEADLKKIAEKGH